MQEASEDQSTQRQKPARERCLKYACTTTIKYLLLLLYFVSWHTYAEVIFSKSQKKIISTLTLPIPISIPQDPSNAYQNNKHAKALGKKLFFDVRLSGNKQISCASCHQIEKAFTDGLPQAQGITKGEKNTPTLLNMAFNRWFFWDGRSDSLWNQAINPITHRAEMNGRWLDVYQLMVTDSVLLTLYNQVFTLSQIDKGILFSDIDSNQFKSNIAKALAAFQSDIIQFNSRFDEYARSITQNRHPSSNVLSLAEKRGLQLFIGKAQCIACHNGPNFSDGEFHNIRLPTHKNARPEAGRYEGVAQLKKNKLNLLSPYSDLTEKNKTYGDKTFYLTQQNSQWTAYKTPTLRNITQTAPYMHNGIFKSLNRVIEHYSSFENAAPNHHKNGLLMPLHLSEKEMIQLIAFLETLTGTIIIPSYE